MSPSFSAVVLAAALLPQVGSAQTATNTDEPAPMTFAGSHSLELSAGLLTAGSSTVAVSGAGVTTEASGRGLLGSLRYAYWVDNDLALQISVSAVNADASISVNGGAVAAQSAAVIPLLIGLKYQPFHIAGNSKLRPYVYGSIGPYLGYSSGVEAGPTTSTGVRWEAAMGARLAVGLDLVLSRLFTLGFQGGVFGDDGFRQSDWRRA
jgi:outer membrane protein W